MREVAEAAERVQRAMRALDAHRHAGASTLERDYRRALEEYFTLAERALGREPAQDDDAEDTVADDAATNGDLLTIRAAIEGHFAAARRALRLARAYRVEPGSSGRRERECIETVQRHREAIHSLRLRANPPAEQLLLPGLAKTRPEIETQRLSRTG